MSNIYYVEFSDGDNYEPYLIPIGYFTSIEKANEAATRYAVENKEDYKIDLRDNGTIRYHCCCGSIYITEIELDVYLPDTW